MLTNTPPRRYSSDEDIDFIHNYYESRVLQEIFTSSPRAQQDREFLSDVACVALNRLPPRYIRHDVDMTFFMSPQETQEIEDKVTQAVKAALVYVESRGVESREVENRERNNIEAPADKNADDKKAVKKTAVKKVKKSE